jgi:hypothetical protein
MTKMPREEFVGLFAKRIATMEGFYTTSRGKPSLAFRNNNPGNLRSWGRYPVKAGFAVFPSVEEGWHALKVQISKNIERKLTFKEFFCGKKGVYPGYAPDSDGNHCTNYATFVAEFFGAGVNTKIFELVQ